MAASTREFLIDRDWDELTHRPVVSLDPTEVARRKQIEHRTLRLHGRVRRRTQMLAGDYSPVSWRPGRLRALWRVRHLRSA
jgi:hypothetical protein